MRWILPALAIAAVSCGGPKDRFEEMKELAREQARETFEAWRDALARGDEAEGFRLMSDRWKSEWLFQELRSRNPMFLRWKAGLKGAAREELDLWYAYTVRHRKRIQRAEPLAPVVLTDPSFRYLVKEVFLLERDDVKFQMKNLVVIHVAVDGSGVTVQVKNALGLTELYQVTRDPRGGWKVDGHLESGIHSSS